MPSAPELSQSKQLATNGRVTISNAVIALLPVLACFLGGATEKWAEGFVVGAFGIFLLVRPPRLSLGPIANCLFVVLVGCAAVSLLPARWFFIPDCRTAI